VCTNCWCRMQATFSLVLNRPQSFSLLEDLGKAFARCAADPAPPCLLQPTQQSIKLGEQVRLRCKYANTRRPRFCFFLQVGAPPVQAVAPEPVHPTAAEACPEDQVPHADCVGPD
jgi:hypothetical protein